MPMWNNCKYDWPLKSSERWLPARTIREDPARGTRADIQPVPHILVPPSAPAHR